MSATIFIDNKYCRLYYMIIERAKSRVFLGYTEKHHIIPKSLGGSNEENNLVNLTAKEHYICHLLLIKMTEGKARTKMRYASYMFSRNPNNNNNRIKITGRRYQYLREQLSIANKERTGPNKGKKFTDEHKQNLSNALKGRKLGPQSDEHRAKVGRYTRTEEHKKALSEFRKAQTGKQKRSEETKAKMSAWQVGIPKSKDFSCEHCGKKQLTKQNYTRWHGKNCKHNR